MRKLTAFLTSLVLLTAVCVTQVSALGTSDAYYYVFDDFRFIQPNAETLVESSFDADTIGGNVQIGTLYDGSENAPVTLQRVLNRIEGKAVLELGFTSNALPEGTTINLRSGDTDAITMQVTDGKLNLVTTRGNRPISDDNTYYGIRAFMDIDAGTYTFQANGTTIGTDLSFLNKVGYIDEFYVETTDEGTGTIVFNHLRIHQDYILNELFLNSFTKIPDDWKVLGSGVSLSSAKCSVPHDMYALYINDSSFSSEGGISHDISYTSDGLWLEYQFYSDGTVRDFGAALSANGKDIIKIGADKMEFGYWIDGSFTGLYTMKPNLWYHAMIKINNGSAEIYLNHKLKAENVAVGDARADNVRFTVGKAATGAGYIDDIMLKPINPLPENYVPKPVVPEKKDPDSLIGIQSCSLWREGTHMGWDHVSGYKERTPLIGFYDEGSSEVADWEIKWLVEHGVDFQMYCWFRQGATNTPINRPVQAYALHDGFFNAEYSDLLKFVIMWENENATGVKDLEDFKTNLVPYWMEQYFKDDRYLVVDNKPVMAFYRVSRLIANLGSLEAVKEAFSYLDAACREEGFDGVYILVSSNNAAGADQYTYLGVDGVFPYSAATPDVDTQLEAFNNISKANTVASIASPGMGWDNSAWGINNARGWMSAESMKELLTRIRDEYMPAQKGFGKRMITLDNWNEISEGHFFYPTGLCGFGYLDAIREVFTNGGAHEDVLPDAEAQARFQRLYVQDRDRPISAVGRANAREEKKKSEYISLCRIDFDGSEDSEAFQNIDGYKVADGIASGYATNNDPSFYVHGLNLNAEDIKLIKIGMKLEGASNYSQVFFVTESDPNWDENKSVRTGVNRCNDDFIEVEFNAYMNKYLTGTITDIRLDPKESEGRFEVDYIEFFGPDPSKGADLLIDGKAQTPSRNIIYRDGKMYVPAAEFASEFDYTWSKSVDGKYLKMLNDETGRYFELEIGKDAYIVDYDPYFPIRQIAESAGYGVEWDAQKHCANLISPSSGEEFVGDEDPVTAMNFNKKGDFQWISRFANISSQKVKNGVLTLDASNSDPNFYWTTNLTAEETPYLNIRIRNKSQGTYFQVFYQTADEANWSEDKSVRAKITNNDSEYKMYTLSMAASAKWKGKITQIRIDPTDGTGQISIDYMIFSNTEMKEAAAGGVAGTNILEEGMLDNQLLKYKGDGASANYDVNERYMGKYSLKLNGVSDNGRLLLPADVKAGARYSLTAWVKSSDVGSLSVGYYNDAKAEDGVGTNLAGTPNRWEKISVSLPSPEMAQSGIYIGLGKGTVYLDNIQLLESGVKTEEAVKFKERTEPKTGPLKVLVIGNSITLHETSAGIGWLGSWGMAATSKDKDYVHLLETMAKEKDSAVQFKIANVWDFEQYFYNLKLISANKFAEYVNFDADIIIAAFGANINNAANEGDDRFLSGGTFTEKHYEDIINYFNPYGDAKVIPVLTTLTKSEIAAEIIKVEGAAGWKLVNVSDLTDEKYTARPYKDAEVFTDAVTDGVLNHPRDLGMQVMAERIWEVLEGYIDEIAR